MDDEIRLKRTKIIITDTSVLINFLNIDRIDLLGRHPGEFVITDNVVEEITQHHSLQQQRLKYALQNMWLSVVAVDKIEEIKLFSDLRSSGRFGIGECSAIACAVHRNYILAIDDVKAAKQARKVSQDLEITTTAQIIVSLIERHLLTIAEANDIKSKWESKYRFCLEFDSFDEFIF